MKILCNLLAILTFGFLQAQKETVYSFFFEFNSFDVEQLQTDKLLDFVKKADSTKIQSIQIFGYTDDVGNQDYNFKLSTKRAEMIKEKLINNGIKNKIILKIEGKGKVFINHNSVKNLIETRSKNRRVDVVLNLKPIPKIVNPGRFSGIQKEHFVGDIVYLENVFFERGSSQLTIESKNELDVLANILLNETSLHFEVQGHVCCVPPHQNEAVDRDTKKRTLSKNRAEAVYNYFISKNIPAERMTYKGYGNTVPLGKGNEHDRRVELRVTKI